MKGEPLDYGSVHRIAVRQCCNNRGDIKPRELEMLLLCHQFDRRGGFFTRPELINSSIGTHSSESVYIITKYLQTKDYICVDPEIPPRAYRATIYNITQKGDIILNYYNRQSIKALNIIKGVKHSGKHRERRLTVNGKGWLNIKKVRKDKGLSKPYGSVNPPDYYTKTLGNDSKA